MDSHRKGEFTEATVIAELKRRSIPVSLPFGDNERYDMVLETPTGALVRVQVKTGWLTNGTIGFHTKTQHTNSTGNTYKKYQDDIDYFIVYCHDLESLYLISEDEFEDAITLRVEQPKIENRRIRWASDYEFDDRWPPDSAQQLVESSQRESISQVIDKLSAEGLPVAKPVDTNRYELIVEVNGDLKRMRVKSGWVYDGVIRYAHEGIPQDVGYLGIFVPELEKLYVVPRNEFKSSITLRVEEPERDDPRINWAEDYEFPNTALG